MDEVKEDVIHDKTSANLISKELQLRDGTGYLRKKRVRKIIRFRHYGAKEDPVNFYREQLMLFVPWRNEEAELLDPSTSTIQMATDMKQLIHVNSKPFYFNRDFDDLSLTSLMNEIESELEDNRADDNILVENDMELTEAGGIYEENFEEDVSTGNVKVQQFLPPRAVDDDIYRKLMRTLNDKQRRFVLNTLHLLKSSSSPFHYFLSGGAGVGKSHVVTAIVQSYMRYHGKIPQINPDHYCVIVAAPTGKAAFNVFGMTLHSTFKLPPTQYNGKLCDLDDGSLSTVRKNLLGVKLFIIDEISMVSVKMFYEVDQRLRQIYASSEDFGGRSIIVVIVPFHRKHSELAIGLICKSNLNNFVYKVGHLRQLPPVAGSYVFKTPKHLPLGECVGNHLWEKFQLFELDEIMRQKGDNEFCKALNNMSEGCMDSEDIKLIKSRECSSSLAPPKEAIRLCGTNEECDYHNEKVHSDLSKETDGAVSIAHDRVQGC
jgi:hypothetical protein